MRYISRIEGKKKVFKNKTEYDAYMKSLNKKEFVRERSRKTKPEVRRNDEWKREHNSNNIDRHVIPRYKKVEVNLPSGSFSKKKFSLVHPTRGRPIQLLDCVYRWMDKSSGHNDIEYIISLDTDDSKKYLKAILRLLNEFDLRVVVNTNKTMVEALNRGAELATGDVLIYVSDDFDCPCNWDTEIQKRTAHTDDWVLFVYDGIQRNAQTISILSRKYYERFGYIYYPEYISMWADPDFTEVAKRLGKNINAMNLLFKHNHCSTGASPHDETYARQNSSKAWVHGENLYYKRMAENFGV